MASFFKAYIITLIIIFTIGVGIMLYIYRMGLESDAAIVWNLIKETIAFQLGTNLVLMFAVALPFFIIIRKFTNFSWLHSFVMWFLVFLGDKYISDFFFGVETIDTIRNLWLAAVFITIIFMPIYNAFQKRAVKRGFGKVDEIFE